MSEVDVTKCFQRTVSVTSCVVARLITVLQGEIFQQANVKCLRKSLRQIISYLTTAIEQHPSS
ncbi:hypothetical protein OUZ56_000473 [Daphnia magna]|uniref:Uncharacterized protein n=1 Tax=Daphnia magna TaxID=35525 RepID=A0ABQ9ZZY1_9CRUS|nr:hypothetical protein OUZ56_000473 [Daphnia magna]